MGVNEAVRSTEFRMAYWDRIEALVSLMDGAAQQKAVAAAETARLGRKTVKRFKQLVESASPGPFSLKQTRSRRGMPCGQSGRGSTGAATRRASTQRPNGSTRSFARPFTTLM